MSKKFINVTGLVVKIFVDASKKAAVFGFLMMTLPFLPASNIFLQVGFLPFLPASNIFLQVGFLFFLPASNIFL